MTFTYSIENNSFLSQLQIKKYAQLYTPVPASLFPVGELDKLYQSLGITEDEAPEPFTVAAHDDGTFRALYTPTLMAQNGVAVVKLGTSIVPIKEAIHVFFSGTSPLTVNLSLNKKTVVIPVLLKDTIKISAEELNNDLENIAQYLAEAKTGSGQKFKYTAKISDLPVGTYKVVDYHIYKGAEYSTLYLNAKLEFELTNVDVYNSETKAIETITIPANETFVIRGNSKLLTFFRANPVVDEVNPANITITGHGTTKGNATAYVKVELSSLEEFGS